MQRFVILSTLLLLCFASVMAAPVEIKTVQQNHDIPSFLGYVPDRLIVVMKPTVGKVSSTVAANGVAHIGDADFDAISDRFAASGIKQQFVGSSGELAKYHKIKFEAGTLEDALAAYAVHPLVEKVEPIGIHAMYATPNDGFYDPYQWYHNQANDDDIDSPEAWNIQTGSTSIILAILDSGTRYYHRDLGGANTSPSNPGAARGNMWINTAELNGSSGVDDDGNGYTDDWIGYDFVDNGSNCWSGEDCYTKDNDPRDFNGHGTHTSGIVGMLTNNGYGMAGVAGGWGNGTEQQYGNGVKVMALRMGYSYQYFGQEYGVVLMDAAAEAFYYAADNGARIASCSWGSSNSGGIGAAATYFINNGGLIFVAAGNDGSQTADYLNGRGDCISVAATDQNDAAASFTTYGTWVDISAPGVGIYSTYHDHADPNVDYWASLDGTSMACPMAAATAAMIWSQNLTWSASQVENQLYTSAENIDSELSSAYIGKMGAGRINLYDAVNTGPPPAPVANFSGSPTSGTEPLTVNFTDLSTNSPTSWSWTFGDGGSSTAQNPSHQYTSAGTYTVSLTATNASGSDVETKTNYITVNACTAPVANFSGSPTSGTAPLTVNFTDLSSGSPTSWSWTFGDGGSSTAQNPSHTYTGAGTYTVSLTATNSCGSDGETKTAYITVTEPTTDYANLPYSTGFETGSFDQYWFTQSSNSEGRILITTANSPRGTYHLTMDDNYNGGAYAQNEAWLRLNLAGKSDVELSFWWKEFGDETHTQDGVFFSDDGGSSFTKVYSLANGNTTYQQIVLDLDALASSYGVSLTGTFVVKFQQYDNYSISTDGMAFDDIEVISNEAPPVADFSADPTTGFVPLTVDFTDLSVGATSWNWTFGDGGSSTAQNPSHQYNSAGTYTVTLTAYNAYGSDVETKTDYITVNESGGWTVITYDDFESGWGNYTDGGGDCSRYTGGTYAWQGSDAIDIQDNSGVASSFYHTYGHDVSGYGELEVDFYFYAVSMDRNEDFWVQYFDGSVWQTVAAFTVGVDFNNNTFYHATVTISSSQYNFPTNARIRFMCDASGNVDDVYIDQIEFRGMGGVSSFADAEPIPEVYSLSQNYPNPFNPTTTIEFSLAAASDIRINVYNITGQLVETVADGYYTAGKHAVTWDAAGYASGIYLYRIQAGTFAETKRMVLLR